MRNQRLVLFLSVYASPLWVGYSAGTDKRTEWTARRESVLGKRNRAFQNPSSPPTSHAFFCLPIAFCPKGVTVSEDAGRTWDFKGKDEHED